MLVLFLNYLFLLFFQSFNYFDFYFDFFDFLLVFDHFLARYLHYHFQADTVQSAELLVYSAAMKSAEHPLK